MCDGDILEPVAIVGLAFRFPQGAVDEDSFWEKLMNKECTSTEFPKDRLNVNAFHNPSPKRMGTVSAMFFLNVLCANRLIRYERNKHTS